jgi:mono/diheme cytochrome c family protein
MKRMRITSLLSVLVIAISGSLVSAEDPVDYEKQVKPLLRAHCFACHGSLKSEGGLRLDAGQLILQGGDGGAVVVAGKPTESSLLERVGSDEDDLRMPQQGRALNKKEIQLLSQWISQGADFPAGDMPEQDPSLHWSFVAPQKAELPELGDIAWSQNPIDRFIAARHQEIGLSAVGPASPAALLRRVYLDLIGLPPTAAEVQAFLADPSAQAYQQVVEKLLADARHGERWGRHWMDIWRYSDWYGRRQVNDVRNSFPHIWRWRDWIIHSLNEDKGYDQMVREMLAADEIYPQDDDRIVATGFLVRNWFSLNYDIWMRDIVEHTGKAFLGLRFNCALCHDHKYDPISQQDYFRLRAFFEPLEVRNDRVPGGPRLAKYIRYNPGSGASLKPISAGLARIYDQTLDAETFMYQLGDQRDLFPDRAAVQPGVPAFLGALQTPIQEVALPAQAYYPGLKPFIQQHERESRHERAAAARKSLDTLAAQSDGDSDAETAAVKAAEELLADRIKQAADNQQPRPQALKILQRAIAYWDFEIAVEEEAKASSWLGDRTGRGHRLEVRANGDAAVVAAPAEDWPANSAFHRLPSGRVNRTAAQFKVNSTGSASLRTRQKVILEKPNWSVVAMVRLDKSQLGLQQVVVAAESGWALLASGEDESASQLRLLHYHDGSWQAGAAEPASPPLRLQVGREYFLAASVAENRVQLYLRELGSKAELQLQVIDLVGEGSPPLESMLSIGDVDGTAWWQGMIDEVALWDTALEVDELAALAGTQAVDPQVLAARQSLMKARAKLALQQLPVRHAELELAAAEAEVVAIDARLAADNAVYRDQLAEGTTVEELKKRASQAVRDAAAHSAAAAVAAQQQKVQQLKVAEKPTPSELATAEKELMMLQAQSAAAQQATSEVSSGYDLLSPTYPATSTGRRRALAEWMASRQNPLTARVAVNHIWMRHFGRPLVESVADLGRSGTTPSHPRLLDWLAVELMENEWSMKHLHRLITSSRTYQMGTVAGPQRKMNMARDKDNHNWWRMEDRRLEAEVIRDSLLAVSGQMDATIGGPVQDPAKADTIYRRSLYFSIYPESGGQIQMLGLFDPPDPSDCYRRSVSVVPQQSLALVNSGLVLDVGRRLTGRLTETIAVTDELAAERQFIQSAFLSVLSRQPIEAELEICLAFLEKQRQLFKLTPPVADATTEGAVAVSSDYRVRARESLVHTLLNHHDFVTIH